MRIFLLIALSNLLFANPLTQLYLEKGLHSVQKHLDDELITLAFWENHIKDVNTTYGYFQNTQTLLHCDKNSSTLNLYQRDANNSFSFVKSFSAFTGEKPGDKQHEGDLKTPVGVYTLTSKLTTVDSFYGPMAFVTSYPNLYDKARNKNGHGIWIHGLPINQKRDEFTKGCIAIDNDDITCLDKHLNIQKTLLIINEETKLDTISNNYAYLLQQLYQWRYAWIYNDIDSYLSFYAEDFVRFDGLNKARFSRYKKRIFAKNELKSIDFSNITILPYPSQSSNLFMIRFHETYNAPSMQFSGEKVLMVAFDKKRNKISIIAER